VGGYNSDSFEDLILTDPAHLIPHNARPLARKKGGVKREQRMMIDKIVNRIEMSGGKLRN
jgi:hypothetical protein